MRARTWLSRKSLSRFVVLPSLPRMQSESFWPSGDGGASAASNGRQRISWKQSDDIGPPGKVARTKVRRHSYVACRGISGARLAGRGRKRRYIPHENHHSAGG